MQNEKMWCFHCRNYTPAKKLAKNSKCPRLVCGICNIDFNAPHPDKERHL